MFSVLEEEKAEDVLLAKVCLFSRWSRWTLIQFVVLKMFSHQPILKKNVRLEIPKVSPLKPTKGCVQEPLCISESLPVCLLQ